VPVAVVTDSTAYLPAGLAAERGIRVVPLEVRLGDRSGRDGTDIGPAELVTALADKTLAVHTSRPTPAAFEAVYREALAAGATGVVSPRCRVFFSVDNLERLRRGGRIGAAAALFGTALAVKPLLHLAEGRIMPLEKVRTSARAAQRLLDLAVAAAGEGADLAVHHLGAAARAEELAAKLRERLPSAARLLVS